MNIPLYQSSTDTKGQLIDLNDALASIRSDARKDKILAIRNETDPIKRDALKRSLDMVCFSSLMSPARGLANVISPTFFSVIDFDHGPNGENYDFDNLKARLIKDPYAYAVFFSPKRGVKVLVRHNCDTIDNQVFHNFYSQLMQYFSQYAIPDKAPSSLASACFLSWDPDIYINTAAKVFHYVPSQQQKVAVKPSKVQSQNLQLPSSWIDAGDAYDTMVSICQHYHFVKGSRNNSLFAFSCQCAKAMIDPNQVRCFIEENLLAPDFSFGEIQKTIDSAYKQTFTNYNPNNKSINP